MTYSEAADRLRRALATNAPLERGDVVELLEDYATLEEAYRRAMLAGAIRTTDAN